MRGPEPQAGKVQVHILHPKSTKHHHLISVSKIILNLEAHHKDRDVHVYSEFGKLQKNLMKGIKVIQKTKISDLIVIFYYYDKLLLLLVLCVNVL